MADAPFSFLVKEGRNEEEGSKTSSYASLGAVVMFCLLNNTLAQSGQSPHGFVDQSVRLECGGPYQ